MTMRNLTKLAAILTLGAAPLALQAQETPQQGAGSDNAAQASPEEVENLQRAVRIMRAFSAAWTSDSVQDAVKGRLVSCFYNNTLSQIAKATGEVFANSPNLDYESGEDLYRAAAGVCGISFRRVGADGPAEASPVNTPSGELGR
ncbi:MAG TPA: hypothetical protein VLA37_09055 [Sphingomonadaceae bacterium]|nr:hypothetical protein [Sphingomonadaceae bacterium]